MHKWCEEFSKYTFKQAIEWLLNNDIEYISDVVDVYTTGNEADWFEIDIWIDEDHFVIMYYRIDGTFRHYETTDF